jgi:hypothetical protein
MNPAATIPVGPELDLAVAKACGIEATIRDVCCDHGYYPKSCGTERDLFDPSTNIETAFEAAEKAGLFDNVNRRLSKEGGREGGWVVVEIVNMAGDEMDIAFGSTPAEAISRAILALAPKNPTCPAPTPSS